MSFSGPGITISGLAQNMERAMKLIDKLSAGIAILAGALFFSLIAVMIYEVVSRYVFGAPTLWAGDFTYMLGGALFILACGYTLKQGGHVSIDFIVMALPMRLREAIQGVLMLFAALPALFAEAWIAVNKALSAYQNGTTDPVSAFAPQLWPFYTLLALGLVVFALQILVSGLRAFGKASGHHG